jgi:hypothetical protein
VADGERGEVLVPCPYCQPDGVALTSIEHPVAVRSGRRPRLHKSALESIEVEVPDTIAFTAEGRKLWGALTHKDRKDFIHGVMFRKLLAKRAKARAAMKRMRRHDKSADEAGDGVQDTAARGGGQGR